MIELNKENIKNIPDKRGVYNIYAKSAINKSISIQRFCDIDKTGLLYIGQTNKQTLKKRIYQFYASAHPDMKTHNHSGAQKYFLNNKIREKLSKHSLWFEFEKTEQPTIKEKQLLFEYAKKFGEYPPLNK